MFVLSSGGDRVTDFQPGRDLLNLSGIDARRDLARIQSFTFIGEEEFSNVPGELRFEDGRLIGVTGYSEYSRIFIELPGVVTLSEADLLL